MYKCSHVHFNKESSCHIWHHMDCINMRILISSIPGLTCVCIASMFAMHRVPLTWQPAACSFGCAVPQGQRAVGIGTQQLLWLETQSHKHSQSPEPDAQLLLGKEEMLPGVPLRLEPRLELLMSWLRSTLLLETPSGFFSQFQFMPITFGSEMELGPVSFPEPESEVTNLKYWPLALPPPPQVVVLCVHTYAQTHDKKN